jgi:putative lipoprotein
MSGALTAKSDLRLDGLYRSWLNNTQRRFLLNQFLKVAFVAFAALYSLAFGQSTAPPAARFIESTCQGDLRINVRFSPAEATVLYRGALYSLKQVRSGSGYRYSDGKLTLTGKGTSSRLEDARGNVLAEDCVGGATLSGTVTYLQRIALPANAVVEVQLQEVSRADSPATVLATQAIPSAGKQVPIGWDLVYDPKWLEVSGRYIVRARITSDGKLIWTSDTAFPVLQSGQSTENLEIKVVQVSTNSSTAQPTAQPVNLTGTKWTLSSYTVAGKTVQVTNPIPTISFDAARASGNGGCNSFSGTYRVQGDAISFQQLITTLKACAPDVPQLETAFLGLLQKANRYTVNANELQIFSTAEDALVFKRADLGTAGQSVTPKPNLKLSGTGWELRGYFSGGKEFSVSTPRPTIIFDANGQRISGTTGCNRYSASYAAKNVTQYDSLMVMPILSTKIACAPAVNQLEALFVTLLQKAERYTADTGTLRITSPSGVLVFTRLKTK